MLFQLTATANKSICSDIYVLLENIEPAPLSVSHFEVENKNWITTAHYDFNPDTKIISDLICETLGLEKTSFELSTLKLEDKDWVSHVQSGLKPVRAGRFFIYGSHDKDKAKDEALAIEINAAQAFGTAHHGTTKGCLVAIDELSNDITPTNILDLGTGTAILAIAAGLIWPNAKILATDIDPIAVSVAEDNTNLNLKTHNIEFLCADGLNDQSLQAKAPFELTIANILAKPLIAMATDLTSVVAGNGKLLLSGILETQRQEVINAYSQAGLTHLETKLYGEWVTILFERR